MNHRFLYLPARKEGRKKIAFALLTVFLFFGLLEIFFRIAGLDRRGAERFYQNVFDPLSVPIPGAQNPYVDLSEFMNKMGLRGPDFTPQKPEGIVRIVCLGDSTTFSAGEYEDSYPFLLEQALNEGLETKQYEVINAGVPGTNIYHQILLFEILFKDASCDLVILMTGMNARMDLKAFRDKLQKPIYQKIYSFNRFLHRVAVYRVMTRILKGGVTAEVKDDVEVSATFENIKALTGDYQKDLQAMDDLSRRWGFSVVVLSSFQQNQIEQMQKIGLLPDDPLYLGRAFDLGLDRILYEFSKKAGWKYIDLTRDFVLLPIDQAGVWHDPHHVDFFGNRLIARRIATELRSFGWLPPDKPDL